MEGTSKYPNQPFKPQPKDRSVKRTPIFMCVSCYALCAYHCSVQNGICLSGMDGSNPHCPVLLTERGLCQ